MGRTAADRGVEVVVNEFAGRARAVAGKGGRPGVAGGRGGVELVAGRVRAVVVATVFVPDGVGDLGGVGRVDAKGAVGRGPNGSCHSGGSGCAEGHFAAGGRRAVRQVVGSVLDGGDVGVGRGGVGGRCQPAGDGLVEATGDGRRQTGVGQRLVGFGVDLSGGQSGKA